MCDLRDFVQLERLVQENEDQLQPAHLGESAVRVTRASTAGDGAAVEVDGSAWIVLLVASLQGDCCCLQCFGRESCSTPGGSIIGLTHATLPHKQLQSCAAWQT